MTMERIHGNYYPPTFIPVRCVFCKTVTQNSYCFLCFVYTSENSPVTRGFCMNEMIQSQSSNSF